MKLFARPAIALSLLALAAAGCGGGGSGSAGGQASSTAAEATSTAAAEVSGREVFLTAGCKNCHTLKAAGATGTVGPNLDELQPDKARVERQVRNGGAVMPSFLGKLSDAQIEAVAEFVSQNAGS